jgi:4-aminobutyrate aminotransferase-like enzyme
MSTESATHLDALVAEIVSDRSSLNAIAPATMPGACDDALARLGSTRGRGAFFPFIGSGRGWGPFVECADGSVKLDMITGIGVHGFGHGDADLLRASLEAATQDTVMQGNLQCNTDAIDFMDAVLKAAQTGKSALAHVFPCCSGAVANENALKICMQHTNGAPRILAFSHCFAGRTTTMSQIGDSAGARDGIALSALVDYLPFEDLTDSVASAARAMATLNEALRRYPKQHACIVVEPVQGEGGFVPASEAFLRPLLVRAREAGVPVWFDEVQSFGRTECMFRQEFLGVEDLVDVLTIGKMSQVCATLFTAAFNPRPGLLSGTFIGSTAGFHVGRAIIERLSCGSYYGPNRRIASLHKHFLHQADGLMKAYPSAFPAVQGAGGDIKLAGGCGGMMRFTPFGGDKARIIDLVKRCFDAGLMLFFCGHGPFHIRMLPPIGVLEPAHLDVAFQVLGQCIESMEGSA